MITTYYEALRIIERNYADLDLSFTKSSPIFLSLREFQLYLFVNTSATMVYQSNTLFNSLTVFSNVDSDKLIIFYEYLQNSCPLIYKEFVENPLHELALLFNENKNYVSLDFLLKDWVTTDGREKLKSRLEQEVQERKILLELIQNTKIE